jgi:hypothetical protein
VQDVCFPEPDVESALGPRFENLRYFAAAVPAADPAYPGSEVSMVDLGVALVILRKIWI